MISVPSHTPQSLGWKIRWNDVIRQHSITLMLINYYRYYKIIVVDLLLEGAFQEISALNLAPHCHELNLISFLQ